MKKILSHGILAISKYCMKCPYCDCEFEYQSEDIIIDRFYVPYMSVICPECGRHLNHADSMKTTTRMITESL